MKPNETPQMKRNEAVFSATFIIVLLIILPMLPLGKYDGGIAMLATAMLGLVAYVILFKQRLRERGRLKAFIISTAVSCLICTAFAIALVLLR